jgi:hypothetical protein
VTPHVDELTFGKALLHNKPSSHPDANTLTHAKGMCSTKAPMTPDIWSTAAHLGPSTNLHGLLLQQLSLLLCT